MSIRLLKDCFAEEEVNELLVACYAIDGASVRKSGQHPLFALPPVKTIPASSSPLTAKRVCHRLPDDSRRHSHAGNQSLNWKTDSTPAGKEENLGACFTDYSGNIITEIPQLTGAYIDPQRGALKVPDVTPEEYLRCCPFSLTGSIICTITSSSTAICRKTWKCG